MQIFDVKGGKNFQDDAKFLEGTRISTAIAQVEQAFLEKKLQEGRILRHIWKFAFLRIQEYVFFLFLGMSIAFSFQ